MAKGFERCVATPPTRTMTERATLLGRGGGRHERPRPRPLGNDGTKSQGNGLRATIWLYRTMAQVSQRNPMGSSLTVFEYKP